MNEIAPDRYMWGQLGAVLASLDNPLDWGWETSLLLTSKI